MVTCSASTVRDHRWIRRTLLELALKGSDSYQSLKNDVCLESVLPYVKKFGQILALILSLVYLLGSLSKEGDPTCVSSLFLIQLRRLFQDM